MDVEIKKIIIAIGEKEIELTWEEMVSLREKLNELLKGKDITLPYVPFIPNDTPNQPLPNTAPWTPISPLPTYPWNPNNPWPAITWCCINGNGDTLKINI
jgi:hypothetical protein